MNFKNPLALIMGASICLVFAGLLYYFNNYRIPMIEKRVEMDVRREVDINSMPKDKIAVVVGEGGIEKYTELTKKIIDEKIRLVEIPEKYAVKGAVKDLAHMLGKVAKEDLRPGEQIVLSSLAEDEKWYGELQRLKEYEVSTIVAGEVRTGNIVDVIVSYGDGYYDVVIPKTRVIKLMTPVKNQAQTSEESSAKEELDGEELSISGSLIPKKHTLIFAIDEEQYRDMELAKSMGVLETRLYMDENQTPSKKTFDYAAALAKSKGTKTEQ